LKTFFEPSKKNGGLQSTLEVVAAEAEGRGAGRGGGTQRGGGGGV